jgi:hypothetical protein
MLEGTNAATAIEADSIACQMGLAKRTTHYSKCIISQIVLVLIPSKAGAVAALLTHGAPSAHPRLTRRAPRSHLELTYPRFPDGVLRLVTYDSTTVYYILNREWARIMWSALLKYRAYLTGSPSPQGPGADQSKTRPNSRSNSENI